MRNGDGLGEHIDRFKPTGEYGSIPINEWAVLHFVQVKHLKEKREHERKTALRLPRYPHEWLVLHEPGVPYVLLRRVKQDERWIDLDAAINGIRPAPHPVVSSPAVAVTSSVIGPKPRQINAAGAVAGVKRKFLEIEVDEDEEESAQDESDDQDIEDDMMSMDEDDTEERSSFNKKQPHRSKHQRRHPLPLRHPVPSAAFNKTIVASAAAASASPKTQAAGHNAQKRPNHERDDEDEQTHVSKKHAITPKTDSNKPIPKPASTQQNLPLKP
jgi:hypothetical protein